MIPDRVVSMATSNGELLLVLANGQWEIADDTDIRSGPTDAMWDTMLAIAGGRGCGLGDRAVFAGEHAGERGAGTTNPSTEPRVSRRGTRDAAEAPARLMVCEFTDGKWTNAEPIPDGVGDDPAEMALTVVNGLPVLAWRMADGRLCVSEMSAENQWSRPVVAPAPRGKAISNY